MARLPRLPIMDALRTVPVVLQVSLFASFDSDTVSVERVGAAG